MVKAVILVLTLLLGTHSLSAQNISGKVLDSQTDEAIAYAHIYAMELGNGAVSDQNGRFQYMKGSELPIRFRITAIGYEEKVVETEVFGEEELLIKLNPVVIDGGEAVVTADVLKESRIRNRRGWLNRGTIQIKAPPTENVAFGVAQKIDFESPPIFPKSYSVRLNLADPPTSSGKKIEYKKADSLKFRLRFVKTDSVGLPGDRDLTGVQIIEIFPAQNGNLTFNLSNYNLLIYESEFYVVIEWLVDDLYRSGEWQIPNYEIRGGDKPHYYRFNLFDRWRKLDYGLVYDLRFEY